MAAPAGIVNDEGHASDSAFVELISQCSPEIADVATAVRDLVYDVLPQTVEVVWPRQRTVGWGTGPRKFTEQFAYLMPAARHVTLGFYRGGSLPDPDGLLPVSGDSQVRGTLSMRSLRLRTREEVQRPALRRLLLASTAEGIPAPRDD